ncbi:deoxyribodipyrimidine photolyase [Longilinea arvoryzae]|uniref:Deoxyribodipyrimidine photo-lyase n=1 Tax=Longilinea arvoryzae TaxID=360412 RepID=A0A0S7BKQ8_9CHLR|nr:deoxyribodipyrimidine photo-lyase [Longilinea arvoryzae]GAP15696.1 deoxyribodipyrimidine photolyase [Longilinea arvoryzae]
MNIWWIRRDLRLEDNPALSAAIRDGAGVLPVFILDERLLANPAEKRQAFLFAGLRELDADLRRLGSRLIVRSGDPVVELERLGREVPIESIFAEQDVSPYARRRDAAVARQLKLQLVAGLNIQPVSAVLRADGRPYTLFTPYSRAWKALPANDCILPAPITLPLVPDINSLDLPDWPAPDGFPAGEREARRRLAKFLDAPIYDYAVGRDRLDRNSTSALSPYLRFGMLSARQAAAAVRQAAGVAPDTASRAGCEAWLNELIWRDFFQSILYHFPNVLGNAFRTGSHSISWRDDMRDLQAWQSGLTGYPVVDAGMRQLAATGWMHNRARMICASFLVKHLLIHWQAGERWFIQNLIDGDPAANNGGWQWVAGTGTDAAPYFRIFNPVLQGRKFDPDGHYVRRWLPELADVPSEYIHTPWKMSNTGQQEFHVILGQDYPTPIVEHDFARQRAFQAYTGKFA